MTPAPRPATASLPVTHPIVLQNAVNLATLNPNLFHPVLGQTGPAAAGLPRNAFKLPVLISPSPSPNEQTLFADPLNAASQFYLPAFGIATTSIGGQPANWVSLSPAGSGFALTVHLSDVSSPALKAVGSAIHANTSYLLRANVSGMIKTWDFDQAATDGAFLELTATLSELTDRDLIYQAMITPTAQARLVLLRSFPVALPQPLPPPPPAGPATAPGQLNIHPGAIVPPGGNPPPSPPVPAISSGPLYRSATVTIESDIPFTFDKDLDANIFSQLSNLGNNPSGWNFVPVNYNGREFAYYQLRSQPNQIYFLPDCFKIGRQPASPYRPSMTVATEGSDPANVMLTLSFLALPVWDPNRLAAAASALQTQLGLDAPPNFALFTASSENIALSLNLPSSDLSSQGLTPQPKANASISVIQAAVTLNLAQAQMVYNALFDGVSGLLSGQVNVTVTTAPPSDPASIPLLARGTDFAGDPFPAQTATVSATGGLTVTLQNLIESRIQIAGLDGFVRQRGNQIPFSRCALAFAPAFPAILNPAQPGASGGAAATPGDSLMVAIQPPSGVVFDGSAQVIFDFSKATVVPDTTSAPALIWQEIEQNQVVGPIAKPITFKLLAALLAAAGSPASSPGSPTPAPASPTPTITSPAAGSGSATPGALLAIQVVFRNGQTANFDASLTADASGFLVQTVSLAVPVAAYVLQSGAPDTYDYRVDQITAGGITPGTWITSNQNVVYITLG